MLVSFCDWMRRQRGASDATLSIYRFELRAFIKELGEDPRVYDTRSLRQFVLDKNRRSGWARHIETHDCPAADVDGQTQPGSTDWLTIFVDDHYVD